MVFESIAIHLIAASALADSFFICSLMSRTESRGTEVKDNREKLHSVPE